METIDSGVNNHVPINNNFGLLAWSEVYGYDAATSGGATWGYNGGRWGGTLILDGTLTLTLAGSPTPTNYIVVNRSTGAISVSTNSTNWDATSSYARVYKVPTNASGPIAASIEDHRAGPYGVIGGVAGPAAGTLGLPFTSDTDSTADSDPGAGLFKWNHAIQSSASILYFDKRTSDGVLLSTLYNSFGASGFILIVQGDDATKWQFWKWTAVPTEGSVSPNDDGYRKFTCALQAYGGAIADAKACYVLFIPHQASVVLRTASETSNATPAPNADTTDVHIITALAVAAAFTNPSGTPISEQAMMLRIKDNGTARALTWGSKYRAFGAALPSITTLSKTMRIGMVYNSTDDKWDCMPYQNEQ